MEKVSFLIIGAAKSGSTTLHYYLQKHPEIYMPEFKEPEFFSRNTVYKRGMRWYENDLFKKRCKAKTCGEASTEYSQYPYRAGVPARISSYNPNMKLLYILRHPVKRAFSHYQHHMREGVLMSFEEALKRNSIYVDASLYMKQIRQYLKHFPRESLKILFLEDLAKHPRRVFFEIEDFLGLQRQDLIGSKEQKVNVGGVEQFVRAKTTAKLHRLPGMPFLFKLIHPSLKSYAFHILMNSPVGKKFVNRYKIQPMRQKTRSELIRFFETDLCELEDFVKRKMPHWRS